MDVKEISSERIDIFLFRILVGLSMETISPEDAFRELETGDEITIETRYGDKINREVTRDNHPKRDVLDETITVGPHKHCRMITYSDSKSSIMLRRIENDGCLGVPGRKVTSFRNWNKQHSFENKEQEDTTDSTTHF